MSMQKHLAYITIAVSLLASSSPVCLLKSTLHDSQRDFSRIHACISHSPILLHLLSWLFELSSRSSTCPACTCPSGTKLLAAPASCYSEGTSRPACQWAPTAPAQHLPHSHVAHSLVFTWPAWRFNLKKLNLIRQGISLFSLLKAPPLSVIHQTLITHLPFAGSYEATCYRILPNRLQAACAKIRY